MRRVAGFLNKFGRALLENKRPEWKARPRHLEPRPGASTLDEAVGVWSLIFSVAFHLFFVDKLWEGSHNKLLYILRLSPFFMCFLCLGEIFHALLQTWGPRFHADRAVGGDSDHRHPHRPPPAGCAESPAGRRTHELPEQPQADGPGAGQLRQHLQ